MIVPVMAISNLVLTRQIYSEEANGAHAHNRDRVPLSSLRFTHSNELRWLDTVFQGQYFLSLSINYFEKLLL